MQKQIEIQRIPVVRAATVVVFTMIAFMFLVTAIATIFMMASESQLGNLAICLAQLWASGFLAWPTVALILVLYNWISKRFGGITLMIRSHE